MSNARLVVCGSRSCTDRSLIERALDQFSERYRIVRMGIGDCPTGADKFAVAWADKRGVQCERFRADWSQGPKAGPLRNQEMVATILPDHVLAFWDGDSPGTLDCMRRGVLFAALVTIIPAWVGAGRSLVDDGDRRKKP